MWRVDKDIDLACHRQEWKVPENQLEAWSLRKRRTDLLVSYCDPFKPYFLRNNPVRKELVFTGITSTQSTIYTFTTHTYHSMPETVEHRLLRSKKLRCSMPSEMVPIKTEPGSPKSPTKVNPRSPIGCPKVRQNA